MSIELRELLEQGKIPEAFLIVDELEEMSLSDKINKIDSYGVILLIHLIKQQAENPTTRSWEISRENVAREINKTNKRPKSGTNYLNQAELMDILQQAYEIALKKAALETLEGRFEAEELAAMVNKPEILTQALESLQK